MFAKLKDEAKVVEDEILEDCGVVEPKFGSILADVIMCHWIDLVDPAGWVNGDKELREFFDQLFSSSSKPVDIELARGTDHEPFYTLEKTDTVDYSSRYTSWSSDRKTALKFIDPQRPLLLLFKGKVDAFDIRNSYGRNEQELILAPCSFFVEDVVQLNPGKVLIVSQKN